MLQAEVCTPGPTPPARLPAACRDWLGSWQVPPFVSYLNYLTIAKIGFVQDGSASIRFYHELLSIFRDSLVAVMVLSKGALDEAVSLLRDAKVDISEGEVKLLIVSIRAQLGELDQDLDAIAQ